MPNWLKQLLLGIGTFLSTAFGVILDEIMKLPEHAPLSDLDQKSIAIACIVGAGSAWAIWKALLSQPPKE